MATSQITFARHTMDHCGNKRKGPGAMLREGILRNRPSTRLLTPPTPHVHFSRKTRVEGKTKAFS